MDRGSFNDKSRVSAIILCISSIALLLEIVLCVFQFLNGIFSMWNFMPLAMIIGILAMQISGVRHDKESVNSDISLIDSSKEDMNSKAIMEVSKTVDAKLLIVSMIALTVFIGLAGLFYMLGKNKEKEYPNVVIATIVDQEYSVDKNVKVEYDDYAEEDESVVTVTESRTNTLFLRYEFNGEQIEDKATIKGLSKVKLDKIQICVDANGKYIRTYDSVRIFYLEAICFAVAAVLILFALIFAMPWEFFVFVIFSLVGMGLMGFVNHPFLANALYNDITAVVGMFFSIGLFGMIGAVLHRIVD